MRALLGCGAAAILMFSAASAADDKKDETIDLKKIVGKWEPSEGKKDFKVLAEFTDKGKLSLWITVMEKTDKIEGTYTVDGNKLDLTLSIGGKEQKEVLTILKLTDEEMATEDSRGMKETFKRIKGK